MWYTSTTAEEALLSLSLCVTVLDAELQCRDGEELHVPQRSGRAAVRCRLVAVVVVVVEAPSTCFSPFFLSPFPSDGLFEISLLSSN